MAGGSDCVWVEFGGCGWWWWVCWRKNRFLCCESANGEDKMLVRWMSGGTQA